MTTLSTATNLDAITTSPGAQIGTDADQLPAKTAFLEEASMPAAPQIPSHLRFMIAGIQDRAMDLSLLGHTGVKAEMDLAGSYAVFEVVTRPRYCLHSDPQAKRMTVDLHRIVGGHGQQDIADAMQEARRAMAAMLVHLNTLIDQELPA